jgi:hypothetical protein
LGILAHGPEEKRGFAGRFAGVFIVMMVSSQICALRWGRVSHRRTYVSPVKTAIGKDTCLAGKCSFLQNGAGTHGSYWHKSDTGKSGFVPQRRDVDSGGRPRAIGPFLARQMAS